MSSSAAKSGVVGAVGAGDGAAGAAGAAAVHGGGATIARLFDGVGAGGGGIDFARRGGVTITGSLGSPSCGVVGPANMAGSGWVIRCPTGILGSDVGSGT